MPVQGPIDFENFPPTPSRGSVQSIEAAESIVVQTPGMRRDVFDYIEQQKEHGATCWEVEKALGLSHQNASARIYELKNMGYIVATRNSRKTNTNRKAAVNVAKQYAEENPPQSAMW